MPPRVSRQYTKIPHRIQAYGGGGGAYGGRAASTALSAAAGQGGMCAVYSGSPLSGRVASRFAFDCRISMDVVFVHSLTATQVTGQTRPSPREQVGHCPKKTVEKIQKTTELSKRDHCAWAPALLSRCVILLPLDNGGSQISRDIRVPLIAIEVHRLARVVG